MTASPSISDRSSVDDEQRLTILDSYCVLDTPPDPAFDDLVTAAASFCRVPIALISFVGQKRQWFKAAVGTDLKETPVEQSICSHVVAARQSVVIPDLTRDPRTQENPLVTGPQNLRFYGGTPLISEEGEVLGSLAVLDTVPRPEGLSATELNGLTALARQAMRLLNLHREAAGHAGVLAHQRSLSAGALRRARSAEIARQDLAQSHASQLTAGAIGGIGTFEVDLNTSLLRASPEMCRILGLPDGILELGDWMSMIHPDDMVLWPSAEKRLNGSAPSSLQYRIFHPGDAAERWLLQRASFEQDGVGRVSRMIGTLQDITLEKAATARLSALLTLGDQLRDAKTREGALASACGTIGRLLMVERVGFLNADILKKTYSIEHAWHAPNVPSLEKTFKFSDFPRVSALLCDGVICTLPDLTTAAWLAEEQAAHASAGIAAEVVVPLMVNKILIGGIFVHSALPRAWTHEETTFIEAAADRIFAALKVFDAEARQETINHEILHRLKNTFALVQALALQGLRGAQDRKAVSTFTSRLTALSSAHDALMQQSWDSADVLNLATDVCRRIDHSGRISLGGDVIQINPDTATALSMVFHELATNAIKHGALSDPNGSVMVRWAVEGTGDASEMVLTWVEAGGPVVRAPQTRGFGLRLLENGVGRQSRMQLSYEPSGLRAELRASIASISAI